MHAHPAYTARVGVDDLEFVAARMGDDFAALCDGLGDRVAAVAREISKKFEETVTGPLSTLAARYAEAPPKGEIVLLVHAAEKA